METTSVATEFDHQQVSKNKRKKFNPKFMLTNSSSDDEAVDSEMIKDIERDQMNEENQSSCDDDKQNELDSSNIMDQISNTNFSISKNPRSNNGSPRPTSANTFLSPTKLSLLQNFNLQQQQHLFQQAAISAIAPQFSQPLSSPLNLGEA